MAFFLSVPGLLHDSVLLIFICLIFPFAPKACLIKERRFDHYLHIRNRNKSAVNEKKANVLVRVVTSVTSGRPEELSEVITIVPITQHPSADL